MSPPVDPFVSFHSQFRDLVGPNARLSVCVYTPDTPFFHEAGIFIEATGEIFVTSNRYATSDGKQCVSISKVTITDPSFPRELIPSDIPMAAGGAKFRDGILFCAQGDLEHPGGLMYMSAKAPYRTETILSTFQGVPFNSVNDVVIAEDGAIWFTDPIYGSEQGIRNHPQLPGQIYRYDIRLRSVRAMADGFGRPNGIAFSPDEKVLYITDTDFIHGDGSMDGARASTIYAFNVVQISGEPFLVNRRLFAFADGRAPDGIKCDTRGGVPLGKVLIPGGVANFCFCRNGEIMAFNEHRLWMVKMSPSVKGSNPSI